jgi:hypothetical protein
VVDRFEGADRGLCDLLSRRSLTDASVDESRFGDGAKLALETLREVATTL